MRQTIVLNVSKNVLLRGNLRFENLYLQSAHAANLNSFTTGFWQKWSFPRFRGKYIPNNSKLNYVCNNKCPLSSCSSSEIKVFPKFCALHFNSRNQLDASNGIRTYIHTQKLLSISHKH